MQPTELFNAAVTTVFTIQVIVMVAAAPRLWWCWRQMKNRRQADEAIATLETAIRARPRWLADSRLPQRRARVREWGGRI